MNKDEYKEAFTRGVDYGIAYAKDVLIQKLLGNRTELIPDHDLNQCFAEYWKEIEADQKIKA